MRAFGIVVFFLLAIGSAVGWFVLRQPAKPMDMSEPVRIHQGIVIGGVDRDNPQIRQFNGIPYASARRWLPPSAPPQWGAISRDAREFGPECLQGRASGAGFVEGIVAGLGLSWWERSVARFALSSQPEPLQSEDCLFVNVRTANLGKKTLQPVMVWLHGGAHRYGASSQSIYQSNGLVEHGVVLVTVNYRLGPFGYLAHPALTEESGTSGNYGLLDQIAALAWVRANISSFGGDPKNVTVFGESAGAQSITELMAAPGATGLFDKVILQSGSSTYNAIHLRDPVGDTLRSAHDVGAEFLSTLAPAAAMAAELRAIPSGGIVERSEVRGDLSAYFLPVVDGKVLPRPIGAAFRDGDVPALPMIAGYNADEATLFYDAIQSPTILRPSITGPIEAREAALAEVYGANSAKALMALYGMTSEADWQAGAIDMLGDDLFGVHMRYTARSNAAAGGPTFLYHFTRVPPSPRQTIGAFHASELAFVFDSHAAFGKPSAADRALTDAMTRYWTNFARTGNPNGDELATWPEWGPEGDRWLGLNHTISVIDGLRARKLDILEDALTRRINAIAPPVLAPAGVPATGEATEVTEPAARSVSGTE